MMARDRVEWTVLGRVIGTATGWDTLDGSDIILYEFVPTPEIDLPSGDLGVLFEKGLFQTYDDEGKETFIRDMIATLRHLSRAA